MASWSFANISPADNGTKLTPTENEKSSDALRRGFEEAARNMTPEANWTDDSIGASSPPPVAKKAQASSTNTSTRTAAPKSETRKKRKSSSRDDPDAAYGEPKKRRSSTRTNRSSSDDDEKDGDWKPSRSRAPKNQKKKDQCTDECPGDVEGKMIQCNGHYCTKGKTREGRLYHVVCLEWRKIPDRVKDGSHKWFCEVCRGILELGEDTDGIVPADEVEESDY